MKLEARSLSKSFYENSQKLMVLQDVSMRFDRGTSYAITGKSGAGKTTLLYLLAGLDRSTQGSVLFNDRDIGLFSAQEQAHFLQKEIGLLFQKPYLLDSLSVIENVMLKGFFHNNSSQDIAEKAYGLLGQIGLAQKAYTRPSLLSGGQQHRVAILRAIFNEPVFLLADEPTGNLDHDTGRNIIDFLIDCQHQWQMGLLISSHDAYVKERMNYCFFIEQGRVQEKDYQK